MYGLNPSATMMTPDAFLLWKKCTTLGSGQSSIACKIIAFIIFWLLTFYSFRFCDHSRPRIAGCHTGKDNPQWSVWPGLEHPHQTQKLTRRPVQVPLLKQRTTASLFGLSWFQPRCVLNSSKTAVSFLYSRIIIFCWQKGGKRTTLFTYGVICTFAICITSIGRMGNPRN